MNNIINFNEVRMNQIWQMWTQGITPQKIDDIVSYCEETCELNRATIGIDAQQKDFYRHSKVGWVNPNLDKGIEIRDILWYYTKIANRNAFGFDVDFLNDIQYTVYDGKEQDKYDWHIDTFWGNQTCYDRKISIVIQLSDPHSYTGGDFQFDPELPQPNSNDLKKKGTVLVFPSFIRHRVTPVLSGTRRSLVAWIEGPKFK